MRLKVVPESGKWKQGKKKDAWSALLQSLIQQGYNINNGHGVNSSAPPVITVYHAFRDLKVLGYTREHQNYSTWVHAEGI